MIRANVSNVRDGLSAHIQRVKAGEWVLITERKTPVACLVPMAQEYRGNDSEAHLRLGEAGIFVPRCPSCEPYISPHFHLRGGSRHERLSATLSASIKSAASPSSLVEVPDWHLRSAVGDALENLNVGYTRGRDSTAITQDDLAKLRDLSMGWHGPPNPSLEPVDLTGLEFGIGIEWFSLHNYRIADLAPLAHLASLKGLNLLSSKIADVSQLANLASLKELGLSDNEIVDVKPLAHITSLESISLSFNKIVDVSPLAHLNSLRSLELSDNEIVDVSPLMHLASLESLDLSRNEIVDVSPLAHLTSLRSLDLSDNEIVDVSPLAGLASLESLDLSGNEIMDVSPLTHLTALENLSLGGNPIPDWPPLSAITAEIDRRGRQQMIQANISEVRDSLSAYLRRVKAGEFVSITVRRTSIACLVPMAPVGESPAEALGADREDCLLRLEEAGICVPLCFCNAMMAI